MQGPRGDKALQGLDAYEQMADTFHERAIFGGTLLRLRDWVYLLGLLIPLSAYNLALKFLTIRASFEKSAPDSPEARVLTQIYLMGSEAFFTLGYGLFWIGLFLLVKTRLLRWVVGVLFHLVAVLIMVTATSAYLYFKQTGTTLDYDIIALYLPRLGELTRYGIISSVSPSAFALLVVAVFYTVLGPWILARFAGCLERAPWSGSSRATSPVVPLGLLLLAFVFGALSLWSVSNSINSMLPDKLARETWRYSVSFKSSAFVNLVVTGEEAVTNQEFAGVATEPPPPARLVPTGSSKQRNVVLIVLESTRARSVTPYNEELETTPFLNELSKTSLLAEQAYAVVPWSSKAEVAINCGVAPALTQSAFASSPEAARGNIPTQCLPELLKGQGYNTAFFMSASKDFDDFGSLVEDFGYDTLYTPANMEREGFQEVNYPNAGSYEDDVMLEPTRQWLEQHKGKPFLATYHTTTPHHNYIVPERYGQKWFDDDETLNRYLNTLRYQDFFLKNLFDQYKKLGLYEDTVFILLGDHGEGFGEHGLYTHGDIPYEEGLRIPLIVHDPQHLDKGMRLKEPVSQLDILPTVADLLGYQIEGGAYQGTSLLETLPEDRSLMFSCYIERKCLASLNGERKYIYHYGDQPDKIFDLSKDPLEKRNLVEEGSEEVEDRRNELLEWRSKTDAFYRAPREDN
jgi:lipoteichoic acid synthase